MFKRIKVSATIAITPHQKSNRLREYAMRYIIVLFLVLCPFISQAQEEGQEDVIYEAVLLTPDHTQLEAFQEAMAEHNQTFHNEQGPYHSNVWAVSTGPNAGKMIWTMGPLSSYAQLDNRPSGEHDDHWQNVVMPTVKSTETVEYWKLNQEWSNPVEGDYSMAYVRLHTINSKYGFLFNDAMEKLSGTIKALDENPAFYTYVNEFQQGDIGRHVATMSFHNNMASLDDDWDFRDTFEEIYSRGDWDRWTRTMDLVMENQYDEIWVLVPELSGSQE